MAFVVLEGPNGAGKTSLVNALKSDGYQTLSSPNGTPLAKYIRACCRGTDEWKDLDPKVQFMLFSAARYDEYVRIVHGKKELVFADRWILSTYVYQCVLGGISVDFLENTRHKEEKIDLVVLLDAPDEVLLERVRSERAKNPAHGNCRWTQEEESQKKIMSIYRNELRKYLDWQKIPYIVIDTTNKTTLQIKEEVLALTKEIK